MDGDGLPNVRMVLMKGFDERGFVFFTNVDSQKGQELDSSGKAALLFHWKSLNRQVRLRGPVERVDDAESTRDWLLAALIRGPRALGDLADEMLAGRADRVAHAMLRRDVPRFAPACGPAGGMFVGDVEAIHRRVVEVLHERH